jgi:hypothetical protein
MYVIGRPVLGWSHRLLTIAVEQGSRLRARLADAAGDDPRPEPAHVADPDGAISGGGSPQPSVAPAVADSRGETVPPTPKRPTPRQHRDAPREATTAAVTPAVVRRWAQEQGIQIGDRGRIAQSVMEQYLAGKAKTQQARRGGHGSSTARRSPSGRRSSAA